MSAQQADLLTSELWALRRAVEPVLLRICTLWLRLHGCGCAAGIFIDERDKKCQVIKPDE